MFTVRFNDVTKNGRIAGLVTAAALSLVASEATAQIGKAKGFDAVGGGSASAVSFAGANGIAMRFYPPGSKSGYEAKGAFQSMNRSALFRRLEGMEGSIWGQNVWASQEKALAKSKAGEGGSATSETTSGTDGTPSTNKSGPDKSNTVLRSRSQQLSVSTRSQRQGKTAATWLRRSVPSQSPSSDSSLYGKAPHSAAHAKKAAYAKQSSASPWASSRKQGGKKDTAAELRRSGSDNASGGHSAAAKRSRLKVRGQKEMSRAGGWWKSASARH